MQTFAQSLIELVISGRVEREIAANSSTNRHDFLVALEAAEKVAREYAGEAGDDGDQTGTSRPSLGAGLR
jgi:hypothetical protein